MKIICLLFALLWILSGMTFAQEYVVADYDEAPADTNYWKWYDVPGGHYTINANAHPDTGWINIIYTDDPVSIGTGALKLEYSVHNKDIWGGYSKIDHWHPDSNAVYDFSGYDSISFMYYNFVPQSLTGRVHLRLCLQDVSDSPNGNNTYDTQECEYYYSFQYILDEAPGWHELKMPLEASPDNWNTGEGFNLTGWAGILGNETLDLDKIKGYAYEFSISGGGEGDFSAGTIVLDHLALKDSICIDFSADLLVSDNCDNAIILTFGTACDATDGFDEEYDQYAPPPPPSGAFDARFHIAGDDLLRDFRATNIYVTGTIEWDFEFIAANGCEPVTVQWNPDQLPDDGSTFRLVDYFTSGSLVNVDMRTNTSYTDVDNHQHFKIVTSFTVFCDVELFTGWNLIGVSVDPLDAVAANLFPNMIPPLYGFNGSYNPLETVEYGTGYWERNTVDETVSIEGYPFSLITISLMAGWNMITGPTCTIAITDVTDPGEIIIPGTLYGFDGAYVPSDSIQPGKGYWLRANAAGNITLDCPFEPSGILAKATQQLPQMDEFGKLTITDAKSAEQTLYLNVELEDESMLESYSLPPLPPLGLFDARFSSGYRISQSDEDMIQLQASEYPVSISISNAVNDSAYTYVITEVVGNKEFAEHILTVGETVEITNTKVRQLKLSKKDLLALPTQFAVSQNYPNPFNPTTEIKYALPENEKVTIVIYDQLGQKVKTLLAQHQEAGYHNVNWNSTNDTGNRVASGIYFYTVVAGKNIAIKKMILLK